MNYDIYERSCLWIVTPINCSVYELTHLWIFVSFKFCIYEFLCLSSFVSLNFCVYEFLCLSSFVSINCSSLIFRSMKCCQYYSLIYDVYKIFANKLLKSSNVKKISSFFDHYQPKAQVLRFVHMPIIQGIWSRTA